MTMRWPMARARQWQARLGWQMGCNFTPSCAINQIEMWQASCFNLTAIERELDLAASLGMNSVRVYLHDLLWAADRKGFVQRIDKFLAAAWRRGIRTMFVLFDSCWDETPALGPQRAPRQGVHNSGWVQSPGPAVLADPAQHGRLQEYVEGVVGRFADDDRILAWDVWNEPDNGPDVAACASEALAAKAALVMPLLAQAFHWARSRRPVQPLTSGIWLGDWSAPELLTDLQALQVANSDVISFHNYGDADDFERRVQWLQVFERPVLCTEFMARPTGSTFEAILPIACEYGVGAFCWGLVQGKTQTHLPWDSWHQPYLDGPVGPWFHDIFEADGTPHDAAEVALIRSYGALIKARGRAAA